MPDHSPTHDGPRRIQMSRQKPWRAEHPDAVIVDRRTKWGNPFRVVHLADYWPVNNPHGDGSDGRGQWYVVDNNGVGYPEPWWNSKDSAIRDAVVLFARDIREFGCAAFTLDELRAELAGKDLACWCPLPIPGTPDWCHAAVLLELANGAADA